MATTVFDVFQEVEFEYLTISRGTVYGNRILDIKTLRGIVKIDEDMTAGDRETRKSGSRVHAHLEDFDGLIAEEIVGNGIRYEGADYTITGVSEGRNFDNNEVEHLTLMLERANYVSDD